MSTFSQVQQLEWEGLSRPQEGGGRIARDPTSAGTAHLLSLAQNARLLFGRVMDGIPYVGTYKVLPERGVSTITCGYCGPGPNGAIGARSLSSIPPGSRVWFIYHREVNYGMIIAVEPEFMTDAKKGTSDFLYMAGNTGLHRNTANSFPFQLNTRGIGDWSSGRPFDGTNGGEWGAITETGLRIALDSCMAQIGTGEACGFWAYYWDHLARVAGINLQIRANPMEWELLDNRSEHVDILGRSVYPWEALGAATPTPLFRELGPEATETSTPWFAAIEPATDQQAAVRRSFELHGYVGQGGKRMLVAPSGNWQTGAANPATTLFEEQVSLTGAYSLRSAKEIVIARRPNMPRMLPKARPEQPEADTPDTYRSSGQFGNGPQHNVTDRLGGHPDSQIALSTPAMRAMGVRDKLAYLFNWENVHPQHFHKEEWALSEEFQMGGIAPPDFRKLQGFQSNFLDDADTVSREIDHRYRDAVYHLLNSHLVLLEDGGISIADGFGGEIRMSGGKVTISSAGDVEIKAGRNVLNWGGRDVIIRANNHVDLSATTRDIRLKAHRHLWALSGMDNRGMMLLENRATADQYQFRGDEGNELIGEDAEGVGIVLRTPNSQTVVWSKDIYLRTGGGDIAAGSIILDAAKGEGSVLTHAAVVGHHMPLDGVRYDAFLAEDSVEACHAFGREFVLFGSAMAALGYGAFDGNLVANDWIYVDHGHIMTALAGEYNLLVPPFEAGELQEFYDEVETSYTDFQDSVDVYYNNIFPQRWYLEKRAGHDETIRTVEFSFRTGKQYGTTDDEGKPTYQITEDRWQQMARAGDPPPVWEEAAVEGTGVETMPFPGKEVLTGDTLIIMDLAIENLSSGVARSRGQQGEPPEEIYLRPTYGKLEAKSPNSAYMIVG